MHGDVEVEDAAVLHVGRTCHLPVVEPIRRELHDGVVHAVLYFEQCHTFRHVLHDTFHHGLGKALPLRLEAFDGGGQLLVVTGEYDSAGSSERYPRRSLQGLCRLIDEEGGELVSHQHLIG